MLALSREEAVQNLQKFYIDGDWVEPLSKKEFPVLNPATDTQIGSIFLANELDVDRAVQAAKKAFVSYSLTSKSERMALLERMLQLSISRQEDLAQAISCEMGAPISLARGGQAESAIGHLRAFIQALSEILERETLGNGDIIVREPAGVCALITPWNWPINQIALKVIPALATGCCCILKPSEYTPISAMIYAEIIHEAGFPVGSFNLIQGDGPTAGSALSSHADIDMVSFTGSTRAGKLVSKAASDTIKRVTLELGGKSANLVFSDCDIGERVTASVRSCMLNSGQSCDAPTRMLVEKSCYRQVLQVAKNAALSIAVDEPEKLGDHIGPLFDKIQFDRVQELIQCGIDEGAELLVGGLGRPAKFTQGWYARPTIFANVSNDMRIAREEIFGPVLVIMQFADEEEAISIANDTPYGLAAYIQTGSRDRAERLARRLRAGSIYINGGSMQYGTPFGGYKLSGNGREGGLAGLEEFFELKSLHFA